MYLDQKFNCGSHQLWFTTYKEFCFRISKIVWWYFGGKISEPQLDFSESQLAELFGAW